MAKKRGKQRRHLSETREPVYEFTPPAELLDPGQVSRLVKELVAKLSFRDPAPRAPAPVRVCTTCDVAFEGLYADPRCTNCWMVARGPR